MEELVFTNEGLGRLSAPQGEPPGGAVVQYLASLLPVRDHRSVLIAESDPADEEWGRDSLTAAMPTIRPGRKPRSGVLTNPRLALHAGKLIAAPAAPNRRTAAVNLTR